MASFFINLAFKVERKRCSILGGQLTQVIEKKHSKDSLQTSYRDFYITN
jgi:hypothetical protein